MQTGGGRSSNPSTKTRGQAEGSQTQPGGAEGVYGLEQEQLLSVRRYTQQNEKRWWSGKKPGGEEWQVWENRVTTRGFKDEDQEVENQGNPWGAHTFISGPAALG